MVVVAGVIVEVVIEVIEVLVATIVVATPVVIESLQLDGVEKLLEISGNRGTSLGTLLHAYYNNYQK